MEENFQQVFDVLRESISVKGLPDAEAELLAIEADSYLFLSLLKMDALGISVQEMVSHIRERNKANREILRRAIAAGY